MTKKYQNPTRIFAFLKNNFYLVDVCIQLHVAVSGLVRKENITILIKLNNESLRMLASKEYLSDLCFICGS